MDTYSQAVAAYSKTVAVGAEDQKPDLEEQISVTLESLSHQEQKEKSLLFYGQAICEVIFGLCFAWLISWITPQSWISLHLSFCAFFLVIFALAMRYPKQIVYSASLLTAAVYALVLLQRTVDATSLYSPRFLLEPFLLLLSGVLMVDILRAQRQRLQEIAHKFASINQELEQTTDHNKILIEQNILLEKQLAEDVIPITKICTILTQLWKKTATEPYEIILNLVMQVTEAQSCAVYRGNAEEMQRRASQSESSFEFPLFLNIGDAVVRTALERCRLCTIRDVLGEKSAVPQDSVVIAGPLVDGNQQVIGMVVIGTMPFSKFTVSTFDFLSALLEVASSSLQPSFPLSTPPMIKQSANGHIFDEETLRLVSQSPSSNYPSLNVSKKWFESK